MNKFIYIQPQIVGNIENWGYAYYSDLIKKDTIASAVRHGYKTLQHDDFIVGELRGDKLICLYNTNGKKRTEKEELNGVKKEFCFK
jgi:hypothetical protein